MKAKTGEIITIELSGRKRRLAGPIREGAQRTELGRFAIANGDDIARLVAPLPDTDKPGNVAHLVHQLIDHHLAEVQSTPHLEAACKPGCHWCCGLRCEISDGEADLIALAIRDDPARQAAIRARAVEVQDLDEPEHVSRKLLCPLLGEDRRCTVYQHRPASCRGMHSCSAALCEAAFGVPDQEIPWPAWGPQVKALGLASGNIALPTLWWGELSFMVAEALDRRAADQARERAP